MTIKEVERYLEVPRANLRFYEKEGLISPMRGKNGYREYSEEDVERLKKIIVFRKLGMTITDISRILDGDKPLSEAIAENIIHLERQILELKGALLVCQKLQKDKEEMETFEVDKYWNVIEEEERKGNPFMDIAKDMVRFEKTIVLENFGIADCQGNLAVSIPKAIGTVAVCIVLFGVVECIMKGVWSLQNFLGGAYSMMDFILLQVIVGIPIFLVGRKRPGVLKKRRKLIFLVLLILFLICLGLIFCLQ